MRYNVQIEINKFWNNIEERDKIVEKFISFLNILNTDDLRDLGVNDRTFMIVEGENILLMKEILLLAQQKVHIIEKDSKTRRDQFDPYIKLRLASPWTT